VITHQVRVGINAPSAGRRFQERQCSVIVFLAAVAIDEIPMRMYTLGFISNSQKNTEENKTTVALHRHHN
jgi:hypothetical protein